MARVLFVDPGAEAVAALAERVVIMGHEVAIAPGALFALTALERSRPDVIVCSATLPDMPGDELCAIVRADPDTKGILFVLIGTLEELGIARASQCGADLIVAGALAAWVLRGGLLTFLRYAADPTAALRVPGDGLDAAPGGFAGSLGALDVATVVQAVSHMNMTGRLSLALCPAAGLIVFDHGRPIHAEFGGEQGERAVMGLLVFRARGGSFAFAPLDDAATGAAPRTIDATAEQLLLAAAAHIDERCAGLDETAAALAATEEA
ncbi:MAG: DUF4388 domain-containing protein [Candidatus Rokubacteria bacterium]|nr:DUF4388 domain-containing protein [Candidatus Rokubacteria bacterium]